MLNINKIKFFFILFFFLTQGIYADQAREDKNILVLHAMVPSTPAYRIITDGIRTKLTEAFGDHYNLHLEYLESERFPRGSYPKERFDTYNEKYKDVDLDLLICIGVDIVDPVKKNASEKIMSLPAIVIDFDLADFGIAFDLFINRKTAVIPIKIDVIGTVNSATALFPDRHNIYFVAGTSPTDRIYLETTRAAENQLDKRLKIHYITDKSMDQVLSEVRKLPESSIVIIPSFNYDSKGVSYYNPESIRLISQAVTIPVFAFSDIGFGDGSVGGYVLSFKKTGLIAGESAVKILNGIDPDAIRIKSEDLFDLIFDWRQLDRWGLAGSKLIPEGSIIKFEEVSFFDRYKLFITGGILFLILQSLLILNLVRFNRKQKMITRQLIDSENRYRELVREDRILSLGQMTASLSHELNQPLTAILSTAQAGIRFLDSNNADPELLKEIFHNIVEDDKRAASILSSIRGMMKLEHREKESVNLNALIEEIISIYQSEVILKKINLDVKLTDQPVYIRADRIQIQQVLLNLITNASQAIEKIKAPDRTIVITEALTDNQVTVSVRDYGEGIDESMKDQLFKPFITSRKEGTGIGLAISRTIIDDHQGKIWAENMPGGGAAFRFSLNSCKDE